ncbi:hypothetical protein E3Q06_04190 [Wallemia mellicola]|uniref:TECPR1-like DysF domain-containing protein n=1 Tax=Wallemia mellicola TaxID=1708541 RepID=A0AB38MPA3_9BASI|nr:hypothetical protein E3Q21_04202 [Wallemia mellicola]TIB83383.1 hypothetical protein E3Q20_04173 [Wallemia mellicola]TIC11456.1 hypothetical protein E3Q13_04396 [Wallemia mellicola]TIC37702.1 hypothetical protein E3Q07_04212 [Wallemia mellicola]TIC44699.1 hypothetical protein E3Q06_04190 [Wallemia mellicola]
MELVVEIPANARKIKDPDDGLTHSETPASPSAKQANSYLANFLTSSLLSSVSFSQPPPDTTTHKAPLNLQTTSVNFRNFVQKTGPIFAILDNIEGIILWRSTNRTILTILVWTLLCLYPRLVLLTPHIALLVLLLRNHAIRYGSNDREAEETPPEPKMPEPTSPDYYMNLQSIQNLMGTTTEVIDGTMPIYKKLNWSDEEASRDILKYVVIALTVTTAVLPWIPVRLLIATGGYIVLAINHPIVKEFIHL